MSAASVMAQGRVAAAALMVDSCVIVDGGNAPTFNTTTGVYSDTAGTTVYEGPCQVQVSDGLNARGAEAGGADLTISRVTVKVPISAEGIAVGNTVRITAAENDPELVDQQFTVIAGHTKTFATCRRLQVERLTT